MISKILARNFRNQSFDQEIDKLTLIVGPNGSGKSSRVQALQIAILGYLPQDGNKQPSSIYSTHGSKVEMVVGFEVNGKRFLRRFKPDPEGTISQDLSLNGKRLAQKEIARTLIDMGDPQIFDLKAFNELSANKKVEFLLDRFPPAGDIGAIDRQIVKLEEKEKALRADLRGAKSSIERLSMERVALKLPAGTLAEVQAEIKAREKELEEAQEELKKQEIAEKEKEAAEKARLKAEDKARREAEAKEKEAKKALEELAKKADERINKENEEKEKALEQVRELNAKSFVGEVAASNGHFLASLEMVRDVMLEVGCASCEALAVLKGEIDKWK